MRVIGEYIKSENNVDFKNGFQFSLNNLKLILKSLIDSFNKLLTRCFNVLFLKIFKSFSQLNLLGVLKNFWIRHETLMIFFNS